MDQTVSPHPHTDLIAGLRELADLMESRPDLAVGRYSSGVSVGVLRSRTDLEAWAEALGGTITMGGNDRTIPVMDARVRGWQVSAQSPAEPPARTLADAEAEIAQLRAELATRAEPDRCKCGFRAPELGPYPACPVHAAPAEAAAKPWTCPYCPFTTDDTDAGMAHIREREQGKGCITAAGSDGDR